LGFPGCSVSKESLNTQKSLAFLYTNNEKIEREIKETIPFTIATKRIKYLGIYLPKETNELILNQKQTHRHSKQTYGYQNRKGLGEG